MNFQIFKLVLGKAEELEIKLPTSTGSSKKQESSRKVSISALLTMPKPLTLWGSQQTLENSKRDGNTRPPNLPPGEICMQVKKQHWELDMEQQTGSKSGKEYVKAVYCHPAYLTSIRVHHEKLWTGRNTSWNQESITSDMQMTPPLWQKVKRN